MTEIQEQVLEYIKKCLVEHHNTPTMAMIADHFEWESVNSSYTHVQALKKKGHLKESENTRKLMLNNYAVKLEKLD